MIAVDLDQPLSRRPNAAERAMLRTLQGNLLAGHGRRATANVFLRFDPQRRDVARAFLRRLAVELTSAADQQRAADAIRDAREAGRPRPVTPPFRGCFVSYDGYVALGVPTSDTPAGRPFRAGMKARGELLGDPAPDAWDPAFRGEVHALVLLGADPDPGDAGASTQLDQALKHLHALLPRGGVQVLGVERGRAYFNASGDGIEHFGFVDGRSQPLVRRADVEREAERGDGIVRWDPAFPLKQVLRRDPGTSQRHAYGAYFVFRKLEQDVRAFRDAVSALADDLQKLDAAFDRQLAGAMLVGRFEDGTPVALQRAAGMHSPVGNDFDYAGDPDGRKCPLHAHVRKMNPRGDTHRAFQVPLDEERAHLLVRRGITYGTRAQNAAKEFTDAPRTGVGLYFMSPQSSIEAQFEFIQRFWASNPAFVRDGTGIDPLIGSAPDGAQSHRAGWGDRSPPCITRRFADFVTLKGGEYFFAPSIAFFGGL